MRTYSEPAAIFLERILATMNSRGSILIVSRTWIILSETSARPTVSPLTTHPPVVSTTSFISSKFKSQGIITSTVSIVPAGDVIALVDTFGIVRPAAARIGIIMGVIRLPAIPPIECLSTTGPFFGCRISELLTIAFATCVVSSSERP
jgi:hypothetical protein